MKHLFTFDTKTIFFLFFVYVTYIPLVHAQLGGTYSIGKTESDYATFAEAVNALQTQGISAPVTFEVQPGVYEEQINIAEINGSSNENYVLFESSTGDSTDVVIKSDNGYILNVSNTNGLIFKQMTFFNENPDNNSHIIIAGGDSLNNFLFEENVIKGTDHSTLMGIYLDGEDYNDQTINKIIDNQFIGGKTGIKADYHRGDSLIVKNNHFIDQIDHAIEFRWDNLLFESNYILSSSSKITSILLDAYDSKIVNNRIILKNGGIGGISNFLYTQTTIANNFITIQGNNPGMGIYLKSDARANIYHNNILITNLHPDALALKIEGPGESWNSQKNNNNIINNIFVNKAGNLLVDYEPLSISSSDYNVFYTTADTIGQFGDYDTFEEWRTKTKLDEHSLLVNPYFQSDEMLIPNNALLKSAGIEIPEVQYDIFGEPRSMPPDIGAVEFEPQGIDIQAEYLNVPDAPITPGEHDIKVGILNNSNAILNDLIIHWKINDLDSGTYVYNHSLSPLARDTFSIASFDFKENIELTTIHRRSFLNTTSYKP